MSDHMKEAERLLDEYASTRVDFLVNGRPGHKEARAALLAHIQRGEVPEGYDIAPTFRGYAKLGAGHYVLHNCPRTDEDHPSLVIAIATEEEKAGRQVGELRQSQPGLMIQPERIAVRIDFKSVTALDALEQQLRFLREDSFPDSLTAAAAPDHFRDAAKKKRQYYFKNNACAAWSSDAPNCICWHDEGTGPLAAAKYFTGASGWREVEVAAAGAGHD